MPAGAFFNGQAFATAETQMAIAKETTRGSLVSTGLTPVPVMGPKYKPNLMLLPVDVLEGSMVQTYDEITGIRYDSHGWSAPPYLGDELPDLRRVRARLPRQPDRSGRVDDAGSGSDTGCHDHLDGGLHRQGLVDRHGVGRSRDDRDPLRERRPHGGWAVHDHPRSACDQQPGVGCDGHRPYEAPVLASQLRHRDDLQRDQQRGGLGHRGLHGHDGHLDVGVPVDGWHLHGADQPRGLRALLHRDDHHLLHRHRPRVGNELGDCGDWQPGQLDRLPAAVSVAVGLRR